MFDVDCPRTPDGDDYRGTNQKNNGKNNILPTNSRPPLPPVRSRSSSAVSASLAARPGGSSSNTAGSRIMTRNAQFSPRPRGGGRRASTKGLEPEEYIATPSMPLPPRNTPVATVAATHYAPPVASSTNPFDIEGAEGE